MDFCDSDAILVPLGYGPLVTKALHRPLPAPSANAAGTKLTFATMRGLIERPRLFGLELTQYCVFFANERGENPCVCLAFNAGAFSLRRARRELAVWTAKASPGVRWWDATQGLRGRPVWKQYGILVALFFIGPQTDLVRVPLGDASPEAAGRSANPVLRGRLNGDSQVPTPAQHGQAS